MFFVFGVWEGFVNVLDVLADFTVFKVRPVIVLCKGVSEVEEVFSEVVQFCVSGVVKEVVKKFLNIPVVGEFVKYLFMGTPRLIPRFRMFSMTLPVDVVEMLMDDKRVEKIFPDNIVTVQENVKYTYPITEKIVEVINVRSRKRQKVTTVKYLFKPLGIDKARKLRLLGKDVTIAVIDTGVSRVLPGVRDKVVKRENLVEFEPVDLEGHGTAVASTIAHDYRFVKRIREESFEIEGIAPNVKIIDVKALGYIFGLGKVSDVIKALEIAVEYGVDIINMSLGVKTLVTNPSLDPFSIVVKELDERGIILVSAAGNYGPGESTITSPGIYEEVITVGAYDPITGRVSPFSSRGPAPGTGLTKPDLVEPGQNLLLPTQGMLDTLSDGLPTIYSPLDGTSFATPITTGLIALMMEFHKKELGKKLTRVEIMKILEEFKDHEKNNETGYGVLTFDKYLKWVETQYGVKPRIEI